MGDYVDPAAGLLPLERALEGLMSDVSETAYCAGWMSDCEFDIWRLIHHGGSWGMDTAESLAAELAGIKALAEHIDRWIVWQGDVIENDQRAVPLDEWRPMFEAWLRRVYPDLAAAVLVQQEGKQQ